MHEVSLVASLVDRIEEVSRAEGFERVLEIRLGVGALSGIVPSCLEFCFPEIVRGTVLEGARLVLQTVEAEVRCQGCGHVAKPEDGLLPLCPSCGSAGVEVRKGGDFRILDLEVV